ncbi:MAG TPA: PilZ domain-containing protein [Beijerinckiaceae bacterium]|nr:PilZ domain-containing protein [Beijerinckiaceae bacterium]
MLLSGSKLAINPVEQRRFQRVEVILHGRFMLPDHSEHECVTIDMSPGGARLRTRAHGKVNDRVIAYLETVGRIEGQIARLTEDGFAMTINATLRRQDKLAAQLTWLANRHELGLPEDRRHERYVPRNPHGRLVTAGGAEVMVRLIDVSLSGAALTTDLSFTRGDLVMLNNTPSKVVRVFERGIAVEFSRPPAPGAFEV